MASQRVRGPALRGQRGTGRPVRWMLAAAAGGAMVLGACGGGSGQSQLDAGGDTTSDETGSASPATPDTGAVVTVNGSTTTATGSGESAPAGVSTTTIAGGSSTTIQGGQAPRSGGSARPSPSVGTPTTRAPSSPGAASSPTVPTTPNAALGPPAAAPPSPQPQSISFPTPGGGQVKYALDRAIGLEAATSSRLPVEYYGVDGPCEIQGTSVLLLGARQNCTVGARQPGNGEWLPAAPVEVTFFIENGDSSFVLDAPGSVAASALVVTVSVTDVIGSDDFYATVGGACSGGGSFSDSFDLDLLGPGTCTVQVDQNANQDFNGSNSQNASIEVT